MTRFEIGVLLLTVGSLTMKEAPAGATTVDFIQEEVKEGQPPLKEVYD